VSLLVTAVVLAAGLKVEGDTSCPQPADVAARFAQLAPTTGEGHRAVLAQLGPTELEVRLLDVQGALIAQRQLEAATCAGLLEATAATLFAWEATLPSRADPVPAARAPLPSIADGPVPSPSEPASSIRWRLDWSVLGALSGSSIRPGAAAAFSLGPRAGLWLGRLYLKAAWPFDAALAGCRIEWFRPTAGLGAGLRLLDAAVHLEAQVAFEVGLVTAQGRGFEDNRVARAFDPALGLGVHLADDVSPTLQVFGELGASIFLLSQVAKVGGVQVNLPLPPVTIEARVGLSLGR